MCRSAPDESFSGMTDQKRPEPPRSSQARLESVGEEDLEVRVAEALRVVPGKTPAPASNLNGDGHQASIDGVGPAVIKLFSSQKREGPD